jgi:hypothetical protein
MLSRRAAFAAPLLLAGCTAAQVEQAENVLGLTTIDAANLWGIALGIAQVAALVVPGLSAMIAVAQAAVTPALNDATQIATVIQQASALTLAAAPHITAQANSAT